MKESARQRKFASMLQQELGTVFQRAMQHKLGKAFITITRVSVSPDLTVARVHVSLLMVQDNEAFVETLNNELKGEIRKHLGLAIGKTVRRVPELIFYLDEGAAYAAKMERIIAGLDIPDEDEDDDTMDNYTDHDVHDNGEDDED